MSFIHYDADSDSYYIELEETPTIASKEKVADGVIVLYDKAGNVVAVEIFGKGRKKREEEREEEG